MPNTHKAFPAELRLAQHHATHADSSKIDRLEDILRIRATATPDAPAVIEANQTMSFSELNQLSNQVAQALLRDGARQGDRISYIGQNASSLLAAVHGSAKMGAIVAPTNYRLAEREVEYILQYSEPSIVILGQGADHLAAVAAGIESVAIVVTPDEGPHSVGWAAWLKGTKAIDPGVRRSPEDTAVLFYSSGTTGHPKGIEITGVNLGQTLYGMQVNFGLTPDSVALAPVPFFHVAGFGLAIISNVEGAALLVVNPTSPASLPDLMVEHSVTHMTAVPTVIQLLLDLPGVRDINWSHLRYIAYGGSPMSESGLRDAVAVFGCKFIQSYGLTETTGGITILDHADHQPDSDTIHRLRSVGRPVANARIRIVDPVTLEEVPCGGRGEVWVSGGTVMRRYWANDAATRTAMTGDGWLRTGDIGSLDEDGYLYIHGRLKDMIISGGENVYPAEVENALMEHPGVAQAAVIGIASDRWGESPMAVIVRAAGPDGLELDEEGLISWARDRMAHFKCPVSVAFDDALPLNASGKVLKTELRKRYR